MRAATVAALRTSTNHDDVGPIFFDDSLAGQEPVATYTVTPEMQDQYLSGKASIDEISEKVWEERIDR